MSQFKQLYVLLITLLGISTFGYSQTTSHKTTVYIVRHAEKNTTDPKNPDPELSMEGEKRVKSLAAKVKREKIAAVFSTKFKRTVQTGSLVAQKNKLNIELYNPANPKALAEMVKRKYKGQKVLIVGHSNTVLELVEAFGVSRPLSALTDDDYDFLFKIDIDQWGLATLVTQNYGKPHHTSVIPK